MDRCGSELFLLKAPLFEEGNTIADNLGIVLFEFFRIHPRINLGKRFITVCFQVFRRFGIFDLKYSDPVSGIILNDQVAASFPVFLIGFDEIACTGEDAGQKCMVKIFFIVMIADRFAEQPGDLG